MSQENEEFQVEDDLVNPEHKEYDDKFEAFLSKFEQDEEEAFEKEVLSKPEPEQEEVEETVVETETDTDKGEDRGLERVAAKEKEVKDLRAALELEKSQFENAKKAFEIEKQNNKGIDSKSLSEQMLLYPEKVIASLGLDADVVMKTLLVSKLGDDNPAKAKLRSELKDLENKRELHSLKAELAAKDAAQRNQAEFAKTESDAEQYVNSFTVDGEHVKVYPTVSKLAKANAKYVHSRVMREIVEDARARYVRGETGDPISFEEAVRRAETDLSELSKLLTSENAQVTEKKDTTVVAKGNNSRITPPTPVRKKKEVTIEDLEEAAINSAVQEYARHRQKSKGGYSGALE